MECCYHRAKRIPFAAAPAWAVTWRLGECALLEPQVMGKGHAKEQWRGSRSCSGVGWIVRIALMGTWFGFLSGCSCSKGWAQGTGSTGLKPPRGCPGITPSSGLWSPRVLRAWETSRPLPRHQHEGRYTDVTWLQHAGEKADRRENFLTEKV